MLNLSNKPIISLMRMVSMIGVAAIVLVSVLGALRARRDARLAFERETSHVVECGAKLVSRFAERAKSGAMDPQAAQAAALEAIAGMRYGDGNYLYVADRQDHFVLHPAKPELTGTSFSGTRDSSGRAFLSELNQEAQKNGTASIVYLWPKPGQTEPSPKLGMARAVPEWGWTVCGGLYIDEVDRAFWRYLGFAALVTLLILVAQLALAQVISMSLVKPLTETTRAMTDVASGNLDFEIRNTERPNEVGELARALEVFRDNVKENICGKLAAEQEEHRRQAEAERKREVLAMADRFEERVKDVVVTVTHAAEELQVAASSLSATAQQTSDQAQSVAAAAEQASVNMQSVASATEELGATTAEISQQVGQASQVTGTAQNEAQAAAGQVEKLTRAVGQIGDVATLIQSIAEQTNLLALNATIEAARAGAHGKGFAVVASEVKTLANQTANATGTIGQQIREVQEAAGQAAETILRIRSTIQMVGENGSTIAAAVEEQNSTTKEIAGNVQQAATGAQEVTRNIAGVSQAAETTGQASRDVRESSSELARQAHLMREEVDRFLLEVRSH